MGQKKAFKDTRFWKIFTSFASGEFLLMLRLDRYILHVIYTFLLFILSIWLGIQIEKTFIQVEANKDRISELKAENNKLNFLLEQLNNSNLIEQRLRAGGSALHYPEKPATRID